MKNCRTCGVEFEPSAHQLRKSDLLCRDCRRAYHNAYAKRRKAEGRPLRRYYYYRPQTERSRLSKRKCDAKQRRNPAYRLRLECRQAFNQAVASGEIERQPCLVCGLVKAEGHHADYKEPFEVVWLCRKHHAALHASLRRAPQRVANVGPDTPSNQVRKPGELLSCEVPQ